jgi:hypothetical protein
LGRSFAGEGQGGPLKDFSTGEPTGVAVEYTEIFSTGSVNSAGDAASFIPDTDAAALFAASGQEPGKPRLAPPLPPAAPVLPASPLLTPLPEPPVWLLQLQRQAEATVPGVRPMRLPGAPAAAAVSDFAPKP